MPRAYIYMGILVMMMTILGCSVAGLSDSRARSLEPRDLLNKTWQWTETITPVDEIVVPAPERYTIYLTDEGRLRAQFDCNSGGGRYQISRGRLRFGPMVSTRMACPSDTLDVRFMRDLQRVASFFIQNGSLYLELPYDSGTMQFRLSQ